MHKRSLKSFQWPEMEIIGICLFTLRQDRQNTDWFLKQGAPFNIKLISWSLVTQTLRTWWAKWCLKCALWNKILSIFFPLRFCKTNWQRERDYERETEIFCNTCHHSNRKRLAELSWKRSCILTLSSCNSPNTHVILAQSSWGYYGSRMQHWQLLENALRVTNINSLITASTHHQEKRLSELINMIVKRKRLLSDLLSNTFK